MSTKKGFTLPSLTRKSTYFITLDEIKAMATKEIILNKIQILISNSFKTPQEAFALFDNDKDGKLSKKEISELLKKS